MPVKNVVVVLVVSCPLALRAGHGFGNPCGFGVPGVRGFEECTLMKRQFRCLVHELGPNSAAHPVARAELGFTMKEWPHAKSSTGNWCLFLLVRPNPSTLHTQPQRVLLSTAHEQETDTDKRAQGFLRCAVPRGTRATALHSRPHFSPRAATRSREATAARLATGDESPMNLV